MIQPTKDDVQNPCEVSQEVKTAPAQEPESAEVSVDIMGDVPKSSQPSMSSEEEVGKTTLLAHRYVL